MLNKIDDRWHVFQTPPRENEHLEGNLNQRGTLFLSVMWKIGKFIAKVKEEFAKLPSLIYQNKNI